MNPFDHAMLALAPITLSTVGFAARRVRTAPAYLVLACLAALCDAVLLLVWGSGGVTTAAAAILVVAGATLAAVLIPERGTAGYNGRGGDRKAIELASATYDEATRTIDTFSMRRRKMGVLARLADAFVTTPEEERVEAARERQNGAHMHLSSAVPGWHEQRTEQLLDADGRRAQLEDIRARLQPLQQAEDRMRHVHNLSVEAIAALDTAISSLETAKTYETIDAFSSNNAISVMSTVQTSSASDDVQEANAAIGRLREASRQEVPASLSAPSDAFDLMMDLCIDSVFDFMSFYNMKRLGDAKTRCHQARDRVMEIERALLRDVQKAATAADPVRTALSDLRATYALKASKELPAAARKYVR